MISVQEAEAKILAEMTPLGIEERGLREALGMVLAEPVAASASLPAFDNSAMDGYAVRAHDLAGATAESPARLALVGTVTAGSVRSDPLEAGQAVQIMTGAAIPPEADTVVILEEARRLPADALVAGRDGLVLVDHPVPAGRHIRRRGEDIEAGREALPAGRQIRPAEIALLAGLGKARVKTFRPPRVALVTTGSELVSVEEPLGPGKIRDSNRWVLESTLRPLGVEVVDCGIIPDEERAVLQAFRRASACDVILSSGGVSVGEHDLVKRILIRELAFETLFWRVRMKPGKPLLFGLLDGKPLFGLPGNPISCAVCAIRFIAPAIRKMMGHADPGPVRRRAVLGAPLSVRDGDKAHFVTARVEFACEPPRVTPTSRQGSGMLTSMAEGNAFIVVPEGTRDLPAGVEVEVIPDD